MARCKSAISITMRRKILRIGTVFALSAAIFCNANAQNVVKTPKTASSQQTPRTVAVKDYFPAKSHTGGEVIIFDANGKEILKTTVKAGERINLSALPAGNYRLRHGSKLITITKK